MTRYFFDIRHDATGLLYRDEDGEECADRQAAEAEATMLGAELIRNAIRTAGEIERSIEIREGSDAPFPRVRAVARLATERLT